MISKTVPMYFMTCDACLRPLWHTINEFTTQKQFNDVEAVMEAAKKEGWSLGRVHRCLECVKENR